MLLVNTATFPMQKGCDSVIIGLYPSSPLWTQEPRTFYVGFKYGFISVLEYTSDDIISHSPVMDSDYNGFDGKRNGMVLSIYGLGVRNTLCNNIQYNLDYTFNKIKYDS